MIRNIKEFIEDNVDLIGGLILLLTFAGMIAMLIISIVGFIGETSCEDLGKIYEKEHLYSFTNGCFLKEDGKFVPSAIIEYQSTIKIIK